MKSGAWGRGVKCEIWGVGSRAVTEGAAAFLEVFDSEAGINVVPFDPVRPGRFPEATNLLWLTRGWLRSVVAARTGFYTAEEDFAGQEAEQGKPTKAKRVTTAQLASQLSGADLPARGREM